MSFSFTFQKMVSFLSNCVVNLIYIIIWYRLSVCMYVCMTMYVCMYGFEILKAVVIELCMQKFYRGVPKFLRSTIFRGTLTVS